MKQYIIIALSMFSCLTFSQVNFDKQAVLDFQNELNLHYANPEKSPLSKEDLKNFVSLDFFEPSSEYFIKAKLVRTPNEKPFLFETTGSKKQLYVKYAELHFSLNGNQLKLAVFQNVELAKNPLYKKSLFLPFTDLTNGVTTYGGGRYIDLEIPETDILYLDFNKAYNPYCAYSYGFSCPIPPEENDLQVEINAGVKLINK